MICRKHIPQYLGMMYQPKSKDFVVILTDLVIWRARSHFHYGSMPTRNKWFTQLEYLYGILLFIRKNKI